MSYLMTLRKREDALNWRRKHQLALTGEFAVEESVDLSQDRLLVVWHFVARISFFM